MKQLAIIIPAYKGAFLDEALQSIAAQTCQDFVVYVGDDASPDDLKTICDRWQQSVNLCYHRFDDNLGTRDLVAQWMRCIGLSVEPWVWLFCDDDLMAPECVAMFYRELQSAKKSHAVYHFDVDIINADGKVMFETPRFPPVLSSREFALKRLNSQLNSFVSEYIILRSALMATGGFKAFPCAWCSDDATWIKSAGEAGIRTIPGGKVNWRHSGLNITSSHERDRSEKFKAVLQYLEWLSLYLSDCHSSSLDDSTRKIMLAGREWAYKQAEALGVSFWRQGLKKSALHLHRGTGQPLLSELLRMLTFDLKKLAGRFCLSVFKGM